MEDEDDVDDRLTSAADSPEQGPARAKGGWKGCLAPAEMRGLKYAAMPGDDCGNMATFAGADLRPATGVHSTYRSEAVLCNRDRGHCLIMYISASRLQSQILTAGMDG